MNLVIGIWGWYEEDIEDLEFEGRPLTDHSTSDVADDLETWPEGAFRITVAIPLSEDDL